MADRDRADPTPLAAAGLAIVQALATGVHIRRGEHKVIAFNITLLVLALLVAVGRFLQLAGRL